MNFNYNIPFNSFKSSLNINSAARDRKQAAQMKSPLRKDVFEKTSIEASPLTNKSAQVLFDNTWNEVLKQNPITKELNIQKPALVFDIDDNGNALASYTPYDNSITFKDDISQDFYIYYLETDEGKQPLGIMNKSEGDKKYKDDSQVKNIKLTRKEKELFIKSALAHELRHCIQDHLILSTQGCEKEREIIKQISLDIKTIMQEMLDINEINKYKELNLDEYKEKKKLEAQLARCDYIKNYKPKKMLKSDTKLKFSIIPTDTRYLSVKEHLAKSAADQCTDFENYNYDFDPREIDAYNYQSEYFLTHRPKGKTSDVRENVIDMIYLYNILYYNSDNMKQSKYGDFI